MLSSENMLRQQLNNYLSFLRDTKGSSQNTLDAYNRDISKFFSYADFHEIKNFSDVSIDDISDYKNYLNSLSLSASSVSRSLSALRSLYQYLIFIGETKSNPAKCIHNDKIEKKDLNILSNKEIDLLLSEPDVHDIKGIRDKAMLEVLYATGIKVSELISLNLDDVNLSLSFIHIETPEKDRFIPMYPIAVKALQNYLERSRKLLVIDGSEQALFVSVLGTRMTRQGFWKILKGYAEQAEINKDITPHTLRHSFAAHLLENGADIHDIQEILGHKDLASTQRYAQYLKDKMKNSYMKYHPRA